MENEEKKPELWEFEETNPPGILVKFLRKINNGGSNHDQFSNTWEALAYFDRIEFLKCEKLTEFYIIEDEINYKKNDYEVQYLSLAKIFTDENINKKISINERYKTIFDGDQPDFPLLVITGTKINNFETSLSTLVNSISEQVKDKISSGKKIIFETFYTLGFSEVAFIFRSNSYLAVLQVLYQTAAECLKKDNNESFFYSIPAYNQNYQKTQVLDIETLFLFPLISSNNICCSITDIIKVDKKGENSFMLFGQYDLGIHVPYTPVHDLRKIKKDLNCRFNEYQSFLLGYKVSDILGREE